MYCCWQESPPAVSGNLSPRSFFILLIFIFLIFIFTFTIFFIYLLSPSRLIHQLRDMLDC